MKEKIEKRLEEYTEILLTKEQLLQEDICFLTFMLNRIEDKEFKEKQSREMKERMAKLAEGFCLEGGN